MRRVHAWEFHEQTFVPRVVRESIVEALGRGLRWGRYYEAIAPTFAEFCSQIDGPLEAVDMCCGSGEPAAALLDALASRGLPQPSFVLTDLFPNPQATESAVARHPDLLTAHHAPVDATALPPSLDRPIRTVFNAFHHFTPELAEQIIRDTIQARRALFVLEPFPRSPLRMMSTLPALGSAMLTSPLWATHHKLSRALMMPVSTTLGVWDAVISALRMHDEGALMAMADSERDGSYRWEYRQIPFFPYGRAIAFMGIPKSSE